MNNVKPERLVGVDLLIHARELHRGIENRETIQRYLSNGNEWLDLPGIPPFDEPLWMYRVKPKKQVVYMNTYSTHIGGLHPSRYQADIFATTERTARIRVEYEVGQFDE